MSTLHPEITLSSDFSEVSLYRKVARKLLPFLFLGYVCAYLDRVNVGFAALRMQADLNFSSAVYGFGAGIFFIGYVLFEVPSNLLLVRIGARKTMTRIMVGWGVISCAMMFVQTPMQFYVARFLLGVFEAGFFPGVLFYLTYWFPHHMRGGITSMITVAIPISGIFGGPLSGFIMSHMDGVSGLHGWQWMFLIEGIPTIILGIIAFFVLCDKPAKANWLTDLERNQIARDLAYVPDGTKTLTMKHVLADWRAYALGLVFFAVSSGVYVISFWLPGMIKDYGIVDTFHVGLLVTIPYGAGAFGMLYFSRRSDNCNERRYHTAGCMIVGATALVLSTFVSDSLLFGLTAMTIATMGIFAAMPIFWTIPGRYFPAAVAAVGIAFVNTIAQFAGFVSPAVIGWIKTETGSIVIGLYLFAAVMVLGAFTLLRSIPPEDRVLK